MVKVDKDKCVACGLCAGLCPESFRLDMDGKSEVISDKDTACAKEAAAQCPVNAISVN